MTHKSWGSFEQEQKGKEDKISKKKQPAILQTAAGKVRFSHFYQLFAFE